MLILQKGQERRGTGGSPLAIHRPLWFICRMGRTQSYSRRSNTARSIKDALADFLAKRDSGAHRRLTLLWKHWDMVMGTEFAACAAPLGHRNQTLIVGAEDAMAAQELAMQTPELLERANAFMDGRFFTKIQIELMGNHINLASSGSTPSFSPPPPLRRPERLGTLHASLNPSSPVTRCYEAYLRLFTRQL